MPLTLQQCRDILNAGQIDAQEIYNHLSEIISTLKANTGKNRELRFNDGGSNVEWERLGNVAMKLNPRMGVQVYLTWYETVIEYQEERPRARVPKGMPLHNLGCSYWSCERYSLGKKYIQLAVIEDILNDRENWRNNQAYRFMRNLYGIPDSELDFLETIVESKRDSNDRFYPESILLEFKLQKKFKITRDFERDIFNINKKYTNKLLQKVNSGQKNAWKYLELLSTYLLSNIDGFEIVGKNVGTGDYEIDVLIKNSVTEDPTFASFGKYILVECKNWKNNVNVEKINHFISKIRFHYASCGILIAKTGISGQPRNKGIKFAELTILKAFHQDNIIVMILTLEDLQRIAEGENMASILIREYERIKFDRLTR